MEERSHRKSFKRSERANTGKNTYRSAGNSRGRQGGSKSHSEEGRTFHKSNRDDMHKGSKREHGDSERPYETNPGRGNGKQKQSKEQPSHIGRRKSQLREDKPFGSGNRSKNANRRKQDSKEKFSSQPDKRDTSPLTKSRQIDRETLRKSHYSKKKQLEYQLSQPPKDGMLRINKYIANTGICSRREADQYIRDGKITINGKVVSEVGTKVSLKDDVRLEGKRLNPEAKVYLVLNKPKDFVTTMDDPLGRKTVMSLIDNACQERIYPVGRLDRMTTGVLLFTNDGELTKKLTHPKYNKKKIYHVFLDKQLTKSDLDKIARGLELEDGFIQADAVSYVSLEDKKQVGIEIHSGKNRIVRRIFEHLGYRVDKLDRVFFAGITKKNLPRGRWRFLSSQEVKMLQTY